MPRDRSEANISTILSTWAKKCSDMKGGRWKKMELGDSYNRRYHSVHKEADKSHADLLFGVICKCLSQQEAVTLERLH